MIATASVHAQMDCDTHDAENLARLQGMTAPDADFARELLDAVHQLQPRSVNWLIEKGVSINGQDVRGVTPLIQLVAIAEKGEDDPETREKLPRGVELVPWPCADVRRKGESTIYDVLMQRSPDLEIRDSAGFTALLVAAARHRFDLVTALHDAGANINAANSAGFTAVFYAPRVMLKPLVKAGADINAANIDGDTNLHIKMRRLRGQRLFNYVDTALKLGARDTRNKRGKWASEEFVDSISILAMERGLGPLEVLRKRIKATRAPEEENPHAAQ